MERGDRVAVVAPATPETAAIFFGTWKNGGILLSMSVLYGDEGIRHRVSDSQARLIVCSPDQAERMPEDLVEDVLVLDDDLLAGADDAFDTADTSADDPAQLYYTSGTTGLAKGILHAHRYILAHEEFVYCHDVRDGERFHGMGEWAWAAGISPLLGPWRLGATQLVYQREGGFDPDKQLDFLARHGATNVFTTPTAMRAMMAVEDAGERYPQKFRIVCSAGEPLNPEAIRWFREQYGLTVLDYYGLSESYPLCANFPFMEVREGSMGRPMPGWDVAILDEDEQPVSQGERGEICLRARSNPHWPLGYWNNEEAGRETFGGEWFHTKDAAQLRRGRLLLVRRARRRRDHLGGLPDRPVRGRVGVHRARGGARGRRGGVARREARPRRQGLRRPRRGPRGLRRAGRRHQGVRPRPPVRLRLSPQDRVRRRPAEDPHRQDPPDRAARARDRPLTPAGAPTKGVKASRVPDRYLNWVGTSAQGLEENESSGLESGQIACSIPSVLLRQVRGTQGEQAVEKVLAMAGVDHTPAYLDDVGNWIWYHEAVALFEAAAELTGDQRIGRRVGEEMVRQHAGTAVATLLRSLGSPEAIYEQLAIAVAKFSTVTEVRAVEVSPGKAVVHAKARPGFTRDLHLCDWARGMLSQPPVLFGLPPANVEETRCELRGDDHCLYTVTWDAEEAAKASDPYVLVTALEAQLAAMSGRLDSMYATARDLIASDDLDAALARITERAADAVRAPKYLLAVRTGTESRLHVHHRGYVDEEANEAARALLDGHRVSATTSPTSSPRSPRRAATTAGSWPSRPPRASSPTSATCSTSTPATPRPCSTPRPRSTMPAVATTKRARCSSSPRTSP